eukprot:15077285-Alexandrium_andersonii.AAC.1
MPVALVLTLGAGSCAEEGPRKLQRGRRRLLRTRREGLRHSGALGRLACSLVLARFAPRGLWRAFARSCPPTLMPAKSRVPCHAQHEELRGPKSSEAPGRVVLDSPRSGADMAARDGPLERRGDRAPSCVERPGTWGGLCPSRLHAVFSLSEHARGGLTTTKPS